MTHNKKLDVQMNLPLCEKQPIELPQDKRRELASALADLLWNAAVADDPSTIPLTGDES